MNVDSVIIPGGSTKYSQAPVVCWNKPIKERMANMYDQWLSEDIHKLTEGENMKPHSRKRIFEWILDAWFQLSRENIIKSFKCHSLNFRNDGTEDDFIDCLNKTQPCKAGRQNLNSQLSTLVDESDFANPIISPCDERMNTMLL